MSVRLVEIIDVPTRWQEVRRIRALEINGRSLAIEAIAALRQKHGADYKRLLRAFRLVGQADEFVNGLHVRRCVRDSGIYEMRGGSARLFFFVVPATQEVVVCTNFYWKAKESRREQDAAFDRCRTMRETYLNSIRDLRGKKAD